MIIDPDTSARAILARYIDQIPFLSLTVVCESGFEAHSYFQSGQIDLLFLEPELPEMNGIDFLTTIPLSQRPMVVLMSKNLEYAIAGYHLDVIDFLEKSFSFDRWLLAVNKALRRMQGTPTVPRSENTETDDYLLVKASHKVFKVKLAEIEYIQGMKEYVAFVLPTRRILSLQSMKVLTKQLPADRFIRIHRSYIVPIGKVNALEGSSIYIGKRKLPIGASYREAALEMIF